MSTNTWVVRVDWTGPRINEADGIELLEQLADLRPAIDVDTDDLDAHRTAYAYLSATVRLEAPSLRQAITTALKRVEAATGVRAEAVEAMTQPEEKRRNARPTIPDLIGNAEIADMLGVTTQRAAAIANREDFPPAVVTTRAGSLRIRWQVEDWAKTWKRQVGRPRKADDDA